MNISKVEEKKQIKRDKLLASAYELFIKKGVYETSIDDIVKNAGVAKGTFYLYFKDKWEIRKEVVTEKAQLLFNEAIINANNKKIDIFYDKLIYIIEYILNILSNNIELIALINKDLSLGLFNNKKDENDINIKSMLVNELKEYNKKIKNPDTTLYFIIELVGSCAYNSLINNIPLSINELKPLLYEKINQIVKLK